MKEEITYLTEAQWNKFPEYVQKWTDIGLTAPADRVAAKDAIRRLYEIAGRKAPHVVWCGSPMSQGLARAIASDGNLSVSSVRDIVGHSVEASVWDAVKTSIKVSAWASAEDSVRDGVDYGVGGAIWDDVGGAIWDSVGKSIRESVHYDVRDDVGENIRDKVRYKVWTGVGEIVWDSIRYSDWTSTGENIFDSIKDIVVGKIGESVRASAYDSGYGQHDAYQVADFDYFRRELGLTSQTDKLAPIAELARSAGWWLPHEHVCWVSERPSVIQLDRHGRLHCRTGPAIQYPDGWSIYAIHGVRVTAWTIED